jgi:hypothetical protein
MRSDVENIHRGKGNFSECYIHRIATLSFRRGSSKEKHDLVLVYGTKEMETA